MTVSSLAKIFQRRIRAYYRSQRPDHGFVHLLLVMVMLSELQYRYLTCLLISPTAFVIQLILLGNALKYVRACHSASDPGCVSLRWDVAILPWELALNLVHVLLYVVHTVPRYLMLLLEELDEQSTKSLLLDSHADSPI